MANKEGMRNRKNGLKARSVGLRGRGSECGGRRRGTMSGSSKKKAATQKQPGIKESDRSTSRRSTNLYNKKKGGKARGGGAERDYYGEILPEHSRKKRMTGRDHAK